MIQFLQIIILVLVDLLIPASKGVKAAALVVIALLLSAGLINAQNIQIRSSLDTNMILIGEQAKLSVEFQYSKGAEVYYPILKDTIVKEIEILDLSIDTILDPNFEHYIINYIIIS